MSRGKPPVNTMSRREIMASAGAVAIGAGLGLSSAWATPAVNAVTKITGPITGGAAGRPFSSHPGDISPFGYLQKENFI